MSIAWYIEMVGYTLFLLLVVALTFTNVNPLPSTSKYNQPARLILARWVGFNLAILIDALRLTGVLP